MYEDARIGSIIGGRLVPNARRPCNALQQASSLHFTSLGMIQKQRSPKKMKHEDQVVMLQHRQPCRIFMEKIHDSCCVFSEIRYD